jgi:hypothetical protein
MSKRVPFNKKGLPVSNPDYSQPVEYTGDGKPDCPKCYGRGVIPMERKGPPVYQNCECVRARNIARNVESGWKGLLKAPRIKSSPLTKYLDRNLWVRAKELILRKHLKHAAIRHIARNGSWFFHVTTDAALITAWLAPILIEGKDIIDPDVTRVSTEHMTLVDLVVPPDLLIIHLGVKRAANKEMPGVLHEALSLRYHEDKPTWIFDQPYVQDVTPPSASPGAEHESDTECEGERPEATGNGSLLKTKGKQDIRW